MHEGVRPAFSTHGNMLYYVKDRYLRTYDFATQRDNPLISIRRAGSAGANQVRPAGLVCVCWRCLLLSPTARVVQLVWTRRWSRARLAYKSLAGHAAFGAHTPI